MVVALICLQAIFCLLRTQKPVSECYVNMERFMGTTVEWYDYCAFVHYLMQSEGCAS